MSDSHRGNLSGQESEETDPFLAAHAAAKYDDEPYTDEQRAAVKTGWEEYQRGETRSWHEVRHELEEDKDLDLEGS